MDVYAYGSVPDTGGLPGAPARIVAQHRQRYEIVGPEGAAYARLKTSAYYGGGELFPTVGDYVMAEPVENGDSLILATLPRRTVFSRRDPGPVPREQAIAANFDTVFILQSLGEGVNEKRLERYLALAWQSGATPVVLLTKADLAADLGPFLARAARTAQGAAVHAVSVRSGWGLEALASYLQPGKTLVFLGPSGVGKSSLVNALAGEEVMATGEIRQTDGRGRHTTTHRQLIRLRSGVLLLDTPGMRELGLWEAAEGMERAFGDVERCLGKCRFADCRHEREPGCAIRAAIAAGELDPARWESYRKLPAEEADRKELLRRKKEWGKSVALRSREQKKAARGED
ncbi:MAG: ribosome small subunit-dependent GTPase A [Oscillospiraceae bacterium]|nr:ribosome small subunit-dependent GTPase A [Oscillospiraceae bacterium]